MTWNLGGNTPHATMDIGDLMLCEDSPDVPLPEIYIIGLQEMVKLGAQSVIQGKNKEKALLWEQIVSRSLNKREKYSCVSKKTMVG